jgi:hypothetical protein
MPTLTSTDLSGDSQGKLNGHLKSRISLVLKIPTSTFKTVAARVKTYML